jgi:hypothetical protein
MSMEMTQKSYQVTSRIILLGKIMILFLIVKLIIFQTTIFRKNNMLLDEWKPLLKTKL